MKLHPFLLVAASIGLTACTLPAGRRDKFTIRQPYAPVAERVATGVKTELEHGMTWTEDAVNARRTDLSDDAVHFELSQWALDIGHRPRFGSIYVRRVAPQTTEIDVVETPRTYGSEPYLGDRIQRWFPQSVRKQLPLPGLGEEN